VTPAWPGRGRPDLAGRDDIETLARAFYERAFADDLLGPVFVDVAQMVLADEDEDSGIEDAGGDPACWAHRVCRECGRFAEDPRAQVCAACGEDLPSRDTDYA